MRKEVLENIIADLKAGNRPTLSIDDFTCFSEEAAQGDDRLSPETLAGIADGLCEKDIVVFERALRAIEEHDLAWIGFKIVTDSAAAQANVDNEVTKKYGEQGTAYPDSFVFFCNDAKEVVCAYDYSPRDLFQMKDVTRGPSMHNDQFEGLTWTSVALFDPVKVWLLGASDVAVELAQLARHTGFLVEVVDDDPAFLSEARFPEAKRTLLNSFDDLDTLTAAEGDYVCVITRGHMHDPESCIWGSKQPIRYIGMMGCKGKNSRVHDLCLAGGMTEEDWENVKRPIGLKFGAKTPAELAISIVAELIDVRYHDRYSEEARAKHDNGLW